jgi:hypothetical protein
MITSAFDNVKSLSDDQLQNLVESARRGDMSAISALNLTSATPALYEMMRRQQIRDVFQKNMMAGQPDSQKQPTVAEQILDANGSGIGELQVPGMMEEESYAGGGIVSFAQGKSVQGDPGDVQPQVQDFEFVVEPPSGGDKEELSIEERMALNPAQERAYASERSRRRFARLREEMGEAPSELSPEEARQLREDYLKQARAITDPYNKRLQELIARSRPDVAGETKRVRDQAEIASYLEMLTKRQPIGSGFAGSLAGTAEAIIGGMSKYEKGIAGLKLAEQKHAEAEMEGIKAESSREAGNLRDALRHEESQRQARKDAQRIYNQGIRDLRGREETELEGIDRVMMARLRDERAAAQIEARERQAEADRVSREKRETERNKARGSGADTIKPIQYSTRVQYELNKLRENRDIVKEARELAVKNKQVTPDGKPDPTAVQRILRAKAQAFVDADLAARGIAVPKESPVSDQGGASPPPGGAVAKIGADGILTPLR